MVKIRLQGLSEEVEKAKTALKQSFHVLYESGPYPNRNSEYVRVYIEAEVKRGETMTPEEIAKLAVALIYKINANKKDIEFHQKMIEKFPSTAESGKDVIKTLEQETLNAKHF